MTPTSQTILNAIANSIEEDVLPGLPVSDWTTSRLRSALLLLRHLERRVDGEVALLTDQNAKLRAACKQVIAATEAEITLPQPVDWAKAVPTVSALTEEHDALNSVADALFTHLHENRASMGDEAFAASRNVLLAVLQDIEGARAPLFDGLLQAYSPL